MKFTFKATKTETGSYQVTVRHGKEVLFSRVGATKAEALHQAKIDAEAYGWIDE